MNKEKIKKNFFTDLGYIFSQTGFVDFNISSLFSSFSIIYYLISVTIV